ncbi:MAG: hypothetical protein JW840_09435 [Candidatus Thermoplasmatota archaeon]|nr:hypothetical protein [Candidatus Thermoplasmatota archaeon]
MPQKGRKVKGRNAQIMMFIPISGTFFTKKVPATQPEENRIDFHLDVIKKIDRLLAEHEKVEPQTVSVSSPPIIPLQPPTPIEPRPSLNKALSHDEMTWQPALEPPQTHSQTTPEEFKTELTDVPEFRFITSHEFLNVISQMQPSPDERVEIIDLNTPTGDNMMIHKTMNAVLLTNQNETPQESPVKNEVLNKNQFNKKVEIIDARTLKQKIYEDACIIASKQADQIEKKAQVYFISSKEEADKKQKKLTSEQSYIPDDFEDRLRALKEKQRKEEEELRREHEEILQKQMMQEWQKTKKAQFEETDEEESEETEQDEQEVQQKYKKVAKKKLDHSKTPRMVKKEEKEAARLRRLEIRQARIEERRHKKEQKKALKLKIKQQQLKEKSMQKQSKQKGKTTSFGTKGKHTFQPEIDEEIKKVLRMTDSLLEHLPDEVIDQFVQSEDFDMYQKVLNKYKVYERVMNKHRIK